MNIEKVTERLSTMRMTKPAAAGHLEPKENKAEMSRKDSVDTSDLSRLISANIHELKTSSAVRTDKISQFAGLIDDKVSIPETAINRIFHRLAS